jgi:hypothetical protein
MNEASYFLGASGVVAGAGVVGAAPSFFSPEQAAKPNIRTPRLKNVPADFT